MRQCLHICVDVGGDVEGENKGWRNLKSKKGGAENSCIFIEDSIKQMSVM